jgi:hypothetical protein
MNSPAADNDNVDDFMCDVDRTLLRENLKLRTTRAKAFVRAAIGGRTAAGGQKVRQKSDGR